MIDIVDESIRYGNAPDTFVSRYGPTWGISLGQRTQRHRKRNLETEPSAWIAPSAADKKISELGTRILRDHGRARLASCHTCREQLRLQSLGPFPEEATNSNTFVPSKDLHTRDTHSAPKIPTDRDPAT